MVEIVVITPGELRALIREEVRAALEQHEPVAWLDQGQVADLIGVARSGVPRLCQRDGLPHTRVGRVYRFKRADVEAWLNACEPRRPTSRGRTR